MGQSRDWLRWPVAAAIGLGIGSVALVVPAAANDSIAHLAAGGLQFGRTDAIEIQKEDLYISTSEVRVDYRFRNVTDKDVTTLVAFPLPDVRSPSEADNFEIPEPGAAANFLAFKTTVDGKPVQMKVQQRAIAVGIDRTEILRHFGLPIAPYLKGLSERIAAFPEATRDRLANLALIRYERFDAGNGWQSVPVPTWTMRTIYYWRQVFPAKATVSVSHRYKPSVGAAVETPVGSEYESAETRKHYRERYCIDNAFIKAARRLRAKKPKAGQVLLTENRLEYILTTGANWAGSIREFTMTVDKGSPNSLVSFCGKGVRKISATRFQVTAKDFTPQKNVNILILKPAHLPY